MTESDIFMHEIKNSLGNIYALAEIIENDPTELSECLPLMKTAINQIKNVERDYNEFRKSGQSTIRLGPVNLATLLSSIAEEYRLQADEKKITINISCKNIKIQTDVSKLRQVLINLIINAIKYNQIGGQILLECKAVAAKNVIIISDSGIGMSPDELKMIGTVFYRTKKIDVPGTGLGWALIKSISNLMKWEITIKSKSKSANPFEYTTVVSIFLNP